MEPSGIWALVNFNVSQWAFVTNSFCSYALGHIFGRLEILPWCSHLWAWLSRCFLSFRLSKHWSFYRKKIQTFKGFERPLGEVWSCIRFYMSCWVDVTKLFCNYQLGFIL